MLNLTDELYTEICNRVIEPNLNRFDARNELADILGGYMVKVAVEPGRGDIKSNVKMFLREKESQGLSDTTIRNYEWQLRLFMRFTGKSVYAITKDDILDYFEESKHLAPTTLETRRSVLKVFFDWLVGEGIITESPLQRIRPFRVPKSIAKALTVEELEILRDACRDIQEKALVETLYSTGCRLREVVSINRDELNWGNRSIRVMGKGQVERIVFFSVRASIQLDRYLKSRSDNCPALFVTYRRPIRRPSPRTIQRRIAEIAKRTSIGKRIHPHTLRHTFATLMLNKGCPMSVVQELLGHSDIGTTQIYARVTHEHKSHSYEKYFHQ